MRGYFQWFIVASFGLGTGQYLSKILGKKKQKKTKKKTFQIFLEK